MSDIFEDMFDEASALQKVDTDVGKNLSQLVKTLRDIENQISDAEAHLKRLKGEKHRLSTEQIPGLMDEMGLDRIDVEGLTVTTNLKVHASIKEENKSDAFAWLRQEGLDDIIKNDVTLSFGKGEDNVAGDVIGMLEQKGFEPSSKTHIHPSTLKKFIKERFTEGKPIDLDLFGAFIANTAEIRRKV